MHYSSRYNMFSTEWTLWFSIQPIGKAKPTKQMTTGCGGCWHFFKAQLAHQLTMCLSDC